MSIASSERPATPISPLLDLLTQPNKLAQANGAGREDALQRQLLATQGLLEKVLANSAELFFVLDREWRYTYINELVARKLTTPKEPLLGKCIWDVFPQVTGDLFYRELHRALAEQNDLSFEYFYLAWQRWFEVRVCAFPNGLFVIAEDITERKQVEVAHRQSEQRLAMALQAAKMVVWEWDIQQDKVTASDSFAELYSVPAVATGRDLFHSIHPDDATHHAAVVQQALATGGSYHAEFRVIRPDNGQTIWIEEWGFAVQESVGREGASRRPQLICFAMEISERKQAEAALRASEERFSKAFHASPQPMCINRIEGGAYIDVNESFARMVQYPRAEIIGRTSLEIGIWKDAEERTRTNATIVAEGGNRDFIHRFHDRNGQLHEIVSAGQLIELSGEPCILSVVTDLTDYKQAERKLRESEEKFATVFHSSPLTITITRLADGRLIEVNETFVQMTGFSREEALGKTPVELGFWVEAVRRKEGLAQLTAGRFVRNSEERFRMKDGRIRTCLISAEIIEIGGEKCVVTVINDISERKQAEETLRQLNTMLEQRVEERTAELLRSNKELDQFAYIASHDLKAPLRSISLLTNWIQEDAKQLLPDSSKEHLGKLQQRVQRMETLLNDLLAYSRAGRQRHRPERVDSALLVRQIVDLIGIPASFQVTISDSLPTLETEQVALDVVLRNLIGNAVKHHHQPESGNVWVSAQEDGEWVQFAVRDDGPGIDAQFHERIFGVFQTLKPRDEVEGSGMGLALVKRLVEMRGGTVQVESAAGQGALFRFTWPKQIAPVPPVEG